MPRVVIAFDPEHHDYYARTEHKDYVPDAEYEVIVDMKASHFRNILRNMDRYQRDIDSLRKLFIDAQVAGRVIREQ